jgi:thymine-DNA glycosylase
VRRLHKYLLHPASIIQPFVLQQLRNTIMKTRGQQNNRERLSNPRDIDGKNGPRRSFRDHISKFGYSDSSPAKQVSKELTASSLPQGLSPCLKRKRSGASNPDRSSIPGTASQTPRRKSTPRSKGTSSTPASHPYLATPMVSNLRDSLRPNLTLVLIGLNPGITTASMGHPYSHPSNGFWKILYLSGITPIQHRPQDHPLLPDLYGIGNTNICARPSRLGSELARAELAEGAKILDEKIALYRPEAACISGKGVWEAVWSFKTGKKKMPREGQGAFQYGWQPEELWLGRTVDEASGDVVWKGAMTFVAPSTSGLNAGMKPAEKEEAWRPIGEWMKKKREEREVKKQMTNREEHMLTGTSVAAGGAENERTFA